MDYLNIPSPELLRKLLRYDPEAGEMFWLERGQDVMPSERDRNAWNSRYAGTRAFNNPSSDGYLRGKIFGKLYFAHRVAWTLFYGKEPEKQIDHIDGNKKNNKIANLRDVSSSYNNRNSRKRSNNTSGAAGVLWDEARRKWIARISVNGKHFFLGRFLKYEDALLVRKEAEKFYGFSCRHGC